MLGGGLKDLDLSFSMLDKFAMIKCTRLDPLFYSCPLSFFFHSSIYFEK